MPPTDRRIDQLTGRSRTLIGALVAITTGTAAVFGWLGWVMLKQDRTDRLEHAADRAVQTLDRQLTEVADALAALPASSEAEAEAPPAVLPDLADAGVTVVFTPPAIRTTPTALVFYPELPLRQEPPATLFAAGEVAEYRDRDLQQAEAAYRRLARSDDPATRAAALVRLARTLRSAGRIEDALAVYADMASLGDAPVIGLPAALVARDSRMRVLVQRGRSEDARREAQTLVRDLTEGRWRLTRGQYAHYVEQAGQLAGASDLPTGPVAVAQAVTDLWSGWRDQPLSRGRRAMRIDGVPLVAVWDGTPDRLAAWVAEPAVLTTRLTTTIGVDVTLSDADGVVAGRSTREGAWAVRTPADTRLPWTLHVDRPLPSGSMIRLTQGQIVVAGLLVMVVFLFAGAYFIGRAVTREMDLARLQADFVSAVSHEFRTPLAAMRQLSELLAAGRVPQDEKRQRYYESLAGESRRLQRLVENLLNFGRLESGARAYAFEPLDPRALVEEVVAEFRSELVQPHCTIEVDGTDDGLRVLADRDAVSLALHNLIDNAVKYSGGDRAVRVGWAHRGDRVALSVRDEGPGITAEDQRRIFGKFVRGSAALSSNVRGTGVGLAMVHQIVTGHGGQILVESRPGVGATFTMILPAVQAA